MTTPDTNTHTDADAASFTASYADVVERLFAEFDGRHSLATIVDVVHHSRTELETDPPSGEPDASWERLARERLQSTLAP